MPLRNLNRNTQPEWAFRHEEQVKKLQHHVKAPGKKTKIHGNWLELKDKNKTADNLTIQLEEIDQKKLAKEGRLKR